MEITQNFSLRKILTNTYIKEIYDYIDQDFKVEDLQQRHTPPLPTCAPSIDMLKLKLKKLLKESKATSLTVKTAEGNLMPLLKGITCLQPIQMLPLICLDCLLSHTKLLLRK